jgi:hypothetical protein
MSIEYARLRQVRFRPKTRPAFLAIEVVAAFHFRERVHDGFATRDEAVKRADSGRAAHKELNAAGVTCYVWLVFLGDPNVRGYAADRAGEHYWGRWHIESSAEWQFVESILTPDLLSDYESSV